MEKRRPTIYRQKIRPSNSKAWADKHNVVFVPLRLKLPNGLGVPSPILKNYHCLGIVIYYSDVCASQYAFKFGKNRFRKRIG